MDSQEFAYDMYKDNYKFNGVHALKVKKMNSTFSNGTPICFETYYDIFVLAPIIGFVKKRSSIVDYTKNEEGTVIRASVPLNVLISNKDHIDFVYKLIMLLDVDYEPSLDERIKKAFSGYITKEDFKRFESYLLGGVDFLYEELIEKANSMATVLDYADNIKEFVDDFYNLYNEDINIENLKLSLM